MEQHPIPQQISSYQFRLVGDMTLKQFFQLAAGILIGLLFYASSLHPLIKWPLVLFFSLLGAAIAFLPYEDRPLDKWIVAFFKSVYSPTIYAWQKTGKVSFFQEEAQAPQENIIAPGGEEKLEAYLKSRPSGTEKETSALEKAENVFLQKITGLFGTAKAPTPAPIPLQTQNVAPKPTPPSKPLYQPPPRGKPQDPGGIKVPKVENIKIEPTSSKNGRQHLIVEEKSDQKPQTFQVTATAPAPRGIPTTKEAQFSSAASPPAPPERANTITGQVMDKEGKIVEAAILEIKDVAGRPVRAVKTNKVGHFIIVTALQNGEYEIVTEKEGLAFDPVKFEAKGEIIPPIAIRANNSLEGGQNETA